MTFRKVLCPHCRAKLETGQRIHAECIAPWADAQAEKAKRAEAKMARAAAKVERASIKARKEAIKTIPALIREAQIAFNAWIRARDFTIKLARAFIEWLYAFGVEHDVRFKAWEGEC